MRQRRGAGRRHPACNRAGQTETWGRPQIRTGPQPPGDRPRSAASAAGPPMRNPLMNSYASLCDDFGVSTYLHGKLEMPTGRETVLHFFEAVQKAFPKMTEFEKRGDNDYMLEEDRESG